ncbi:hypothetical protein WL78_00505 [Burkholderia ubonensis]|nr:hypothetical protein WL78_00505 [Burkholderia ubonensis]
MPKLLSDIKALWIISQIYDFDVSRSFATEGVEKGGAVELSGADLCAKPFQIKRCFCRDLIRLGRQCVC